MFGFHFIFGSFVLATFIPVYFGLYLVSALDVKARYPGALRVGLASWHFYDTMGDAASLGENNSICPPYLLGGLPHIALIGAFVAGVATLAAFDHVSVPVSGSRPSRTHYSPSLLLLRR